MAEWEVPAGGITIIKDGKPYYSSAFGQRDIAKNLPATINTLFGIASCTKSFTAASLSILADEGKLDWDKPVKTYMPASNIVCSVERGGDGKTLRFVRTFKNGSFKVYQEISFYVI